MNEMLQKKKEDMRIMPKRHLLDLVHYLDSIVDDRKRARFNHDLSILSIFKEYEYNPSSVNEKTKRTFNNIK